MTKATETKSTKKVIAKIRTSNDFASDNRYLAYLQLQYLDKSSKLTKTECKAMIKTLVLDATVSVTFASDKTYTFARIFNNEKLARRFMRHNGYRVSLANKTRSDGKTLFAHQLAWLGKKARIKNISERRDYESALWKIHDALAKKEVIAASE